MTVRSAALLVGGNGTVHGVVTVCEIVYGV